MKSTLFCLLLIALVGVSCPTQWLQKSPEITVPGSDKDMYVTNVNIKSEDLLKHIGLMKAEREHVPADKQSVFDQQAIELDQDYAEFVRLFGKLKEAPESSFMEKRSLVNAALQKTEDLYAKMLEDYKLEIPA